MNDQFICPYCGAHTTEETVKCDYCGSQLRYSSEVKPRAAQQVTAVNNAVVKGKPLSKWTAFWLCFFLGYLGAHKLYEGNAEMGLIYMFTCGLLGFGWIIDIFAILSKPDPYYV